MRFRHPDGSTVHLAHRTNVRPLVLVPTPRAVSGRVAATEEKSPLLRLAGLS